jgi:hypothetical protein
VANEGGCEVLWDARPLALGGEPLSGGVEHEPRTLQPETFPISRKELHDSIDRKGREKGTRFRQDRQQMAFQKPMERYLPFRRLGLQGTKRVLSYREECPEIVLLPDDILRHEPCRFPGTKPGEQTEQQKWPKKGMTALKQADDLAIIQNRVGGM